jgi:hypothetical protein
MPSKKDQPQPSPNFHDFYSRSLARFIISITKNPEDAERCIAGNVSARTPVRKKCLG